MIPADTNRNTTVWPLADLFDALRREGFQLRPDDYVEIVQVLNVFQPQSYADLQALIAPLVVTSDDEQEKFGRIFETVRQKEGIKPHSVKKKPLPWKWLTTAFLVLLAAGYVAFFWPGPTFKTDIQITGSAGPFEVGDTLVFGVDSSLRRAAGPMARWQWEKPDGRTYPHPDVADLQVPADHEGPLVVNLRSQRGRGLLFTTWTDSLRGIEYPICATLPVIQIDSTRLASPKGILRYRFKARLVGSVTNVQLTHWQLNGTTVASNQNEWVHTFQAGTVPAYYDVRFEAIRDTTQRLCFAEAKLSVGVLSENKPPFTLSVRQTGALITPKTQIKNAYLWAMGITGVLLTIVVGFYFWLASRRLPERPESLSTDNPLVRFVSDKPPLEIPLENREAELITLDQRFYQIVRTLRQPVESEARRLHVARTMQATMREGGFPTLIFQPHLAEIEYLFLIDRSQVRSQQVALFEYLFRAFIQENVCAERFFFHKTFDTFTNETHSKGLTLRQLVDSYRSHTLIIWSNGYPLLYPPYPVVEPAIRDALAEWESRAILTPVPFDDWGAKERALQTDFLLLPADLIGQLRLMQALSENQTRQDTYLHQQTEELYSTDDVDFRNVADLRDYLGDDLFQWLAALAIYPRIRWEVVVEMGRALMPPETVNFTNLLKLARISWMQEGSFPDTTRFALLKALRPENEAKARQTLLRMLKYAEQYFPGEHFYDGEKYILQTASQFALYAHDADTFADYQPAQQAFKNLYDKGLYPDGAMLRYLENPDADWTTLLSSTKRSVSTKEIKSSASRPRNTSLQSYFENLPLIDEPPQPIDEPSPKDPRQIYTLVGIILLFLSFLGLWYWSSRPQNQIVDQDQQIPITIVLDTNACVTALNTRIEHLFATYATDQLYESPARWSVFLNDSLFNISSLYATRSFPLRNLVTGGSTGFDNDTYTNSMGATLSVNDTTAGGERQYSSVQLTRDTLHVRINCPISSTVSSNTITPNTTTSRLRVSVEYTNPSASNFGRIQAFMNMLAADTAYQFIRPLKTAVFAGRSQVRYFRNEDKAAAEALAVRASKALRITVGTLLTKDKRSPLTHLDVWINNGVASQTFTCQTVSNSWVSRFDKWQATDRGYTYTIGVSGNELSVTSESPTAEPVVDPKTGAVRSVGTALTTELDAPIESTCQQNGVYLVRIPSRAGRTLLFRNVTRSTCDVADVGLFYTPLNGPQGQSAFNKLLKSASFRRYTVPKQSKSKVSKAAPDYTSNADVAPTNQVANNPAVQQTAKPGNDNEPNANQTNMAIQAPVQSETETLRVQSSRSDKGPIVQRGIEALQRRQYTGAIMLFDQYLANIPNSPYVMNLKGYAQFKLKQYDQAVATLLAITKGAPDYAWPYFDLARVYCAMGKSAEANDARRQAIALQSDMRTIIQNDKEFMDLCGGGATAK